MVRKTSTNDRDRALRRLKRTTSVSLAAAGALVAAFAGLAARALPGRQTVTTRNIPAAKAPARTRAPATPPPLVPAGSSAAPAAPAAPASPPVQSQAPPVVVSGGT